MVFVNVWDELDFWMLSAIIAVPAAFAVLLVFIPARFAEPIRWWTLTGTLTTFVLVSLVFVDFLRLTDEQLPNQDRHAQLLPARSTVLLHNWQTAVPVSSRDLLGRKPWIGQLHIDYFLGVDGLNMALLLLAASVFILAFVASWRLAQGVRGFCMLFLLLEACVMGVFLALDFFLFFCFLTAMLLPVYFLLARWGTGRRPYAAIQFLLTALLGAVLILVAMLALYYADLRPYYHELDERAGQVKHDPVSAQEYRRLAFLGLAGSRFDKEQFTGPVNTFDLVLLTQAAQASAGLESRIALLEERLLDRSEDPELKRQLARAEEDRIHWQAMSPAFQLFCFLFLFLGFALYLPAVPLHTWMADVHEEAPTPVSMILSGVLLCIGGYGMVRIALPVCPIAAKQLAWVVALVGVIGIMYAALVALAQTDLKRLLAYWSVSQMGFVLLGLAAWTTPDAAQYWSWGMNGAVFHLLAHGVIATGLLFCAGILQERLGHTDLARMGGLAATLPVMSATTVVLCFAAMGLPLLSGFVGPFWALLGSWNFRPEAWPSAGQTFALFAAGSFVLSAGYLSWAAQRIFLGPQTRASACDDLDGREGFVAGVCVVITVALGLWPKLVFDWLEPTVTGLVQTLADVTSH